MQVKLVDNATINLGERDYTVSELLVGQHSDTHLKILHVGKHTDIQSGLYLSVGDAEALHKALGEFLGNRPLTVGDFCKSTRNDNGHIFKVVRADSINCDVEPVGAGYYHLYTNVEYPSLKRIQL